MGLFDTIYFTCPNCGQEQIEVQRKAKVNSFETFWSSAVPLEIAVDIEGQIQNCPGCGRAWELAMKILKI